MRLSRFRRFWAIVLGAIARTLIAWGPLRRLLARKRSEPIEGRTFDPQLAAIFRLDDLNASSDLRGLSIERARVRVAAEIVTAENAPLSGVATRDFEIPCPAGPRAARVYIPDGIPTPAPGIYFIHGGGFVTGDLDTHETVCRRFAKLGRARVIAIDYRLAPEHPFPAAVDDVVAGFRWIAAHADELDLDPARLAVTGDSAGGNLAAVLARRTATDATRPKVHAPIYGAFDAHTAHPSRATFAEGWMLTAPMIEWYYEHYFASRSDRAHPDGSPLLAPDLAGIAPALVYTAAFDPLRDEGHAYARRLADAGVAVTHVTCEHLPHGFLLMTGLSTEARQVTERIAREIGDALYR